MSLKASAGQRTIRFQASPAGGGYEGPGHSPDRADAMVWGVSELMRARAEVRVWVV